MRGPESGGAIRLDNCHTSNSLRLADANHLHVARARWPRGLCKRQRPGVGDRLSSAARPHVFAFAGGWLYLGTRDCSRRPIKTSRPLRCLIPSAHRARTRSEHSKRSPPIDLNEHPPAAACPTCPKATYGGMCILISFFTHVCMKVCLYACTCARVHVCKHACMHACMCVSACVHAYLCVHLDVSVHPHMNLHPLGHRIANTPCAPRQAPTPPYPTPQIAGGPSLRQLGRPLAESPAPRTPLQHEM